MSCSLYPASKDGSGYYASGEGCEWCDYTVRIDFHILDRANRASALMSNFWVAPTTIRSRHPHPSGRLPKISRLSRAFPPQNFLREEPREHFVPKICCVKNPESEWCDWPITTPLAWPFPLQPSIVASFSHFPWPLLFSSPGEELSKKQAAQESQIRKLRAKVNGIVIIHINCTE